MSSARGAPAPPGLGEELEALKRRSGRSYAALAHRTGLSSSTLHRYCQGSTVPNTFGAVESIARACAADEAELDRLYRAWRRAVAEQDADPGTGTGSGTGAHAAAESGSGKGVDTGSGTAAVTGTDTATGPPGARHPAVPRALHAGFWLRAAALLVVLVVTSYATAASHLRSRSDPRGPATGAEAAARGGAGEQRLRGPDWSATPRRVPARFFGLTLNTDTGRMPGFRTGAVRLWESETRWGTIEPDRGRYDWSTADRMVEGAERKDLPVLFTLSGTPLWAGPPDARRSGYEDSLASPPEDLADWDRFVGEIAERYRGRVESYELWDYPSHPLHYAGSLATLAEMVERASRIIRRADPSALIACPSFGGLWTGEGRETLRKFARTGAFKSCDAAALKLPPRKAAGPPEETVELAEEARDILYEEGVVDLPLWNTGTDRDVAVAAPLDARRARDYAVRFYLAGLYAWHSGVRRMYFYSWGSTGIPLVVQPVGGRPTEAGRRMERLFRWLADARISGCGKGTRMGLAEGAYTCRFERHGEPVHVYWTTRGRARVTLGEGAGVLRHMDGGTARVRPGDRIGFGEEPVLVEYRAG
ncbi:helix-turn-helix domain-containing protein [Streptomyces winkii]|uniref:helix-turn-helix domain-containing protein n=1 Tax=Streptomyces winkii TaxID=3051178 RepID=UPI0028D82D58|nr:helix-turn-helix domain-containing protein [Streptomyces sp. DSM 40971]